MRNLPFHNAHQLHSGGKRSRAATGAGGIGLTAVAGHDVRQLPGLDAELPHFAAEVGHVVLVEVAAPLPGYDVAGVGRDKVAHTAAGVDDAALRQELKGFHRGVDIDLEQGGVFAQPRHATVGGVVSGEHLVAQALGYLHVDGESFLEIHKSLFRW